MLLVSQPLTFVLQVSTLNLFKTILDDQKSLPKDQTSKDLVKLVNFILHQFFKAMAEEPFLAVEVRFSFLLSHAYLTRNLKQAFFPKNRGYWKQYSSWEPEAKGRDERETVEDTKFPTEVQVKKGYSWSEQIGIGIAALVEDGKAELVEWVKDVRKHNICFHRRLPNNSIDIGASHSSA